MSIKKIILICVFLFTTAAAQVDLNKTAQSTMNFLLVGTSSRACAMGEAYTAHGTGAESMLYNPAGLTRIGSIELNVNYAMWIADINYLSAAAALNLSDLGVIGLHFITVDYGTINGTSLTYSAGKQGYIDNGVLNNVGAYSVGISYARAVSEEFSFGGTVKLVGQNLGESFIDSRVKQNNASKIAFDAGIKYYTGFKSFSFGMSIRNFSSDIRREEINEQLPLIFSLGAAMNIMELIDEEAAKNNSLTFSTDFLHQNNYSERVNAGIQYDFMGSLFLRGGYQTNRDLASWSGGVGLKASIFDYNAELNYSYSKMEIFDYVNRFSLLLSF